MAIDATDWTITRSTGNIRYTGDDHGGASPTYATVIELRRWLGQLSDDESPADPSDELAIYDEDPADRLGTDNIIRLKGIYNIDDGAAEHLYDGSIIQGSGDTETIYDGFVNFGNADAIQIIQNGAVLSDDWWNLAAGGGVNPDATAGISHRFMLKVKELGVDIDGRRIVGTARTFLYTYGEFKVNGTSRGNNTLALSEALDLNNETAIGTVAGWTGITLTTEGYAAIDVNNDGTDEDYYSEWNTNQPTRSINDFYERMKWLTRDGSASTLYGLNGELFRGITHSIDYDTEVGGGLTEGGLAVWGTTIEYDTELSSGLTVGENYIFSGGARGQLLALDDDGAVGHCIFGLSDTTAIADSETFVRADGTANDGASTVGAATGEGDVWGAGVILAKDTGNAAIHIQILKGTAPTDGVIMTDASLAGVFDFDVTVTATVDTTVTERDISTPFIGSSTGTSIVGAYGVGIEYLDLKAADKVTPLEDTVKSPPDNQTFEVSGVEVGEDRILVAPWDGTSTDSEGFPAIDIDQLSLSTTLSTAGEVAVVVSTAIPTDTPGSGVIRVELDDGNYRYQAYTSWTGSTFTIAATDYTGGNIATSGNNVYIAYIDKLAASDPETFTATYIGDRTLVAIVRDGGGTPIKQYISQATFNSGGGGAVVTRTSDL
jgi:hypothetical protein